MEVKHAGKSNCERYRYLLSKTCICSINSMGCLASKTIKIQSIENAKQKISPQSNLVIQPPPESKSLSEIRQKLIKLGIPVDPKRSIDELHAMLHAILEDELNSITPASIPTPRPLSLAPPPPPHREKLSPISADILHAWLSLARSALPPPPPVLPRSLDLWVKRGGVGGMVPKIEGGLFNSMAEERLRESSAQGVRLRLKKVFPDQVKASTVSDSTPGFGIPTPAFGIKSDSPKEKETIDPLSTVREVDSIENSTPAATPRAIDEIINVGGFEFAIGETVEFGSKGKKGVVQGPSKDGVSVRIRSEGKLIKTCPHKIVRIDLRVKMLFAALDGL